MSNYFGRFGHAGETGRGLAGKSRAGRNSAIFLDYDAFPLTQGKGGYTAEKAKHPPHAGGWPAVRFFLRAEAQRRRNCGRGDIGGAARSSLWRKLMRPLVRS
jgi:hypothetical protein